jgi:hypothetical protein
MADGPLDTGVLSDSSGGTPAGVRGGIIGREHLVLYELAIDELTLKVGGVGWDISYLLENGRTNYGIFQALVGAAAGLMPGSEGGKSDLSEGHEVKAYRDPELYPASRYDLFHTAGSSAFGPNNNGPKVKEMLNKKDYAGALALCRSTGYDKNAAYIYTNTGGYSKTVPFRYIIVPTDIVIRLLSDKDPRKISRRDILSLASRKEQVDVRRLRGGRFGAASS